MLAQFDFKATLQASAYFLKKANAPMKYLKLLKLLYLADREMLLNHGLLITCDNFRAMQHGPVLSNTYDNIKGIDIQNSPIWSNYIRRLSNYYVELIKDPGIGWLSEAETDVLDHIYNQYGRYPVWKIRDFTHELPEWKNKAVAVDSDRFSIPFTPIDVLKDNNREDIIPAYQEHRDIAQELDKLGC